MGLLGQSRRFPLAEFNRLKKERAKAILEANEEISSLRRKLDEEAAEIEVLKKKQHKLEERTRRKKRKVSILVLTLIKWWCDSMISCL